MGGAVGKVWAAQTQSPAVVGDCLDDIRAHAFDTERIGKNLDKLHRLMTTRVSLEARAVHARALVHYKGVEALCDVVRKHGKDELLMRSLTSVLAHAGREEEVAEGLRVHEAKPLLYALADDLWEDDFVVDDVTEIFFQMKHSLTRLGKRYMEEAEANGEPAPVFLALRNQPKELVVHLEGMATLLRMFHKSNDAARSVLEVDGALKQVLLTLTRFHADAELQKRTYGVINLLGKADIQLATVLGRIGTIAVITHNLARAAVMDRDQLQEAIWALSELGKARKNLARLATDKVGLVLRKCQRQLAEQHDATREAGERDGNSDGEGVGGGERYRDGERASDRERAGVSDGERAVASDGDARPPLPEQLPVPPPATPRPLTLPLKIRRLIRASEEAGETEDSLSVRQQQSGAESDADSSDSEAEFVIQEVDNTDSCQAFDDMVDEHLAAVVPLDDPGVTLTFGQHRLAARQHRLKASRPSHVVRTIWT